MSNDRIVEEITKQVLSRLVEAGGKSTVQSTPSLPTRTHSGNKSLIVLTGGSERLDEVYRQVSIIAERSTRVVIVLSSSAEKIIGVHQVRRLAHNAEVITGFCEDLQGLLSETNVVYVPVFTLNTASKVAQLQTDNIASLMIVFAILRGIQVIAATDSVYCCEIADRMERIPPGAKREVDAILQKLRDYGVQLVSIEQLTGAKPPSSSNYRTSTSPFTPPVSSTALPLSADCDGLDCDGCGQCAERRPNAVESILNSGASRIGSSPGVNVGDPRVAGMIDHTLLKPDATEEQIRKLCEEAKQFGFASVCVNPSQVPLAAELLRGSSVKVCTVIGFPLGATTPTVKEMETRDAIANGATEIDMVINVGALKSGNDRLVEEDIRAVVNAARGKAIVKVILETALLTNEEKVKACLIVKRSGADFVKTSTGFGPGGATVEDIALMRQTVGPEMGVKASGGIRTPEDAQAMIEAGATRIGASASVAIVKGESAVKAY